MSSGIIVGRTGKYKIFPVAGTAVMAVGFLLLSQMGPDTSTLVQSLYLVVLGAGIGMCMQVLVLIVQNTVDFSDLGVATSGVTFFRTIGSSFGAAVFGSLFNNFLHTRLTDALAVSGAPPEAAQSPDALHQLPPEMVAPIAAAYAGALDNVFLYAAPVAVVGFVLALMLKQVPLRNNDVSTAADLGEGFAMPTSASPDQLLENAVGRLIRHGSGMQLRALAQRQGSKLDISRLWALLQVYRFGQAAGQARLGDIAEHVRVPREILEPAFERLAVTGYAERSADQFWLTPAGAHQVEVVREATMDWLTQRLAQSSGLQAPGRGEVHQALERVTQDVLVQRDWTEDETQAMRMRPPRRAPRQLRAAPAPVPTPPSPKAPVPPTAPIPTARIPAQDTRARPPQPMEPPTRPLRPLGPPRGPRPPHR
jgi:Mn-dependent DtxR family transcriptional regulator